ncbi:hypothetical protein A2924_00510 [Candidatus Giovannonibacteria bacterium RIFCSPLOWO2_01_FULL_44_16]|uniref:Uncharacterized protein n=1 Tax=Candidatus Giovannonibacteria bacterium RIFCSPLOWO2_01_FULL_44_16 TaxID=1798348 RepID=A0A1F5X2L3_9BACT|nr:MAG: hypothetical protein A2924_00510 [Candidatus Giovannonibacteria bacterium RIFCSPLOWO2_01_FULL_44_16]
MRSRLASLGDQIIRRFGRKFELAVFRGKENFFIINLTKKSYEICDIRSQEHGGRRQAGFEH